MGTAWEVDTAVYADKSKYVGDEDANPYDVTFSSDGSKMYIMGLSNDTVYQYTLSTAWDVSTATYATKLKDVNAQDSIPLGVTFSPDGSKMYIIGATNKRVFQYALSPTWDVSSAEYADKSGWVGTQESGPNDVTFSSNGSKMYIVGADRIVYQYTLTPWDVSTAVYAEKFKAVSDEDMTPYGVVFSSDGSKMYILGTANDFVYQYTVSTNWDVSSAEYADKSKYVRDEEPVFHGGDFSSDGTKMYIVGTTNDTVYQYTLPIVVGNALFFAANF